MFGFPETTHIVFKNNFLRNVTIHFQFIENVSAEDFFEQFRLLFNEKFPVNEIGEQHGWNINFSNKKGSISQEKNDIKNKFLILKSSTNNSILEFKNNEIIFNIIGNEYVSFDLIKEIILKIKNFILDNLKIQIIGNLSIRKLNVLEIDESLESLSSITYSAFNDLLNSPFDCPSKENVINDYRTITLKRQNSNLIVKYGLNSPKNIPGKTSHIFIDILAFSSEINTDAVIEVISDTNKEVFNVFNWLISEKLIALLKN